MADNDAALREHLFQLLTGAHAHVDVLSALKGFPPDLYGKKPQHAAHTGWELLEHMRIALRDLWDFSTNPEYVEQKWPDDYWPASPAPPSEEAWHDSVRALKEDLEQFGALVKNPESNLYARIPWGKDQTLLREVLLAADHNSYHTGELVYLRRLLGAWSLS
jgi:DinB family